MVEMRMRIVETGDIFGVDSHLAELLGQLLGQRPYRPTRVIACRQVSQTVLKAAVPYQHAFWVHDQVTGIGHVPVLALIVPIRREAARIFCYETAAIKNVNFEVHAGSHIQGVCGRSEAHLGKPSRTSRTAMELKWTRQVNPKVMGGQTT